MAEFVKWVTSSQTMASTRQQVGVIESWEDIDGSDVLENQFNKLIAPSKSLDSNSLNKKPVQITLTGDDALRSQYVPPEPTVKILKRPSKDAHNQNDLKVFQPKKTLQQREQEYAEARRRILGEESPADENGTSKSDERLSVVNKAIGKSVGDTENVIRLPKGPDGSNGFKMRR